MSKRKLENQLMSMRERERKTEREKEGAEKCKWG